MRQPCVTLVYVKGGELYFKGSNGKIHTLTTG